MTLRVAIASENDDFDGVVYAKLLALALGANDVEAWQTPERFTGWQSIPRLLEPFARKAAAQDVRHLLVVVDNDGGAKRHLEHSDVHDAARESKDTDGCRTCWARSLLPSFWAAADGRSAVAVPVQTLETWLLCAKGEVLDPTPERFYHRRALKRRLFGSPKPPADERTRMALSILAASKVLEILRLRASFVRFENELANWP